MGLQVGKHCKLEYYIKSTGFPTNFQYLWRCIKNTNLIIIKVCDFWNKCKVQNLKLKIKVIIIISLIPIKYVGEILHTINTIPYCTHFSLPLYSIFLLEKLHLHDLKLAWWINLFISSQVISCIKANRNLQF
jgi:hypothetical protein